MKKLLLIIIAFFAYSVYGQCVDPLITDFECSPASHTLGGNGVTSISNPVSGGINTSTNVGEYTDDGTNGWDNLLVDYGTPIDLSSNSVLHIKIHTTALTAPIPLLAKLEGGTAMEIWGSIDVNGEWKEYTFDFSAAAGNGNTELVLFFNGGETNGTASDIYYIDDLGFQAPVVPPVPCNDPVISNFECTAPSHAFGGNGVTTIANPVSGGINTSANVGEYEDNGTDAWDNLLIDYGAPIDLSVNNILKIKIHTTALGSAPIPLLAKLEGGTAMEIWGSIDVKGDWKEYEFDFSAAAGNGNTKLVLFFNGGETTGTTSDTYYIDDLKFTGASLSTTNLNLENEVLVYPNPLKNMINIHSKIQIDTYELFDVTWKRLMYKKSNGLNADKNIDISVLKSGIYFLKVKSGQSSKTIKILKE